MKRINKFVTVFIFVITLYTLYSILNTPVFSQSILPLQASPARQQITIDPGKSANVTIKFFNLGETALSGIVKAADFIVTGNAGQVRLIDDSSQISPKFAGSTWVKLSSEQVIIADSDKTIITAKITVPTDAKPGGRYVAVYFEPSGPVAQSVNGQAGSSVSSRIASLIYIKVNGPITENATIFRLFAPSFLEYGPIDIDIDIINRGDYHITPRGTVTLSNTFGESESQTKIKEQNIFPDTIRSYSTTVGQKWMFGRYKIFFSGSYGDQGKGLDRYTYIWVFPYKIIGIILLAIIILLIIIRKYYLSLVSRSSNLESQVEKEREEIEKLKKQLKDKIE